MDDERGWLRRLSDRDGAGAVVAYGGGGLSAGAAEPTAVERALLRGVARPDGEPPVVCLVPTANGDDDRVIERFRAGWSAAGAEPHVLSLFRRTEAPFGDILDRTDLVYVTGGAVANLAALWRLHGLDQALLALWRRGVPMAGSSAGALIWSAGGVTTSFGVPAGWTDGLALIPHTVCPHFDTQPERARRYRSLVAAGELAPGYGVDDAAAAVLAGGRLVHCLADVPGAGVHPVAG